MGFRKVIQLLAAIAFVAEVLNPTTAFVRERPNPIHHEYRTHISAIRAPRGQLPSHRRPSFSDEYITASAVVPEAFAPVRPETVIAQLKLPAYLHPPQVQTASIQRPPSLS